MLCIVVRQLLIDKTTRVSVIVLCPAFAVLSFILKTKEAGYQE
jgi:hypothetical protein